MKKVQTRVLFILLIVIVTQSFTGAKHPLPATKKCFTQNHVNNSTKAFDDVTLLFSNSATRDIEVWLYPSNSDDWYYIDVSPNATDVPLTVPAGTYEISIAPDDDGTTHHFYSVGCNTTGGGYGDYIFNSVSLDAGCNVMSLE